MQWLSNIYSSVANWASANQGAIGTALQTAAAVGTTAVAVSQAQAASRAAREEADITGEQQRLEQFAQEKQQRTIRARNIARAGAAGVDPFSGSPLEVDLDNAFNAAFNRETLRYSGDLAQRSARQRAAYARAEIPAIGFGALAQTGSIMGNWYRRTRATTTPGAPARIPSTIPSSP